MNVIQLLTEAWQYFARHFITGYVIILFLYIGERIIDLFVAL
jgi:hypothetical protein